MNSRKKAYFSGSFDMFHVGHLKTIIEAKKIADREGAGLIIGVNTDELYKDYKDKEPVIPYDDRVEILKAIRYVDGVLPQPTFQTLPSLKKYKIDIYIMCEEWEPDKGSEKEYMDSIGGKWFVLPRFRVNMCSTEIKNKIRRKNG